jgi:FdhE protein
MMAMGLEAIKQQHPEWEPWLAVVGAVMQETRDPRWERFVPGAAQQTEHLPLLMNASIVLSPDYLRDWISRLIQTAAGGTAQMATLRSLERAELQAAELFRVALCQDALSLREIALRFGADPETLQSVAALLPVPFLHACARRLAGSVSVDWLAGYCPLCGAWPAFAEIRGIERARYLRCGRCGEEWQHHGLQCAFCDSRDHDQLASLVPQSGDAARAIDACKSCGGYLKSFTALQAADAIEVMIKDLASVDLDIAAIEHGYRRPDVPGAPLEITVKESKTLGQRIFFWS